MEPVSIHYIHSEGGNSEILKYSYQTAPNQQAVNLAHSLTECCPMCPQPPLAPRSRPPSPAIEQQLVLHRPQLPDLAAASAALRGGIVGVGGIVQWRQKNDNDTH